MTRLSFKNRRWIIALMMMAIGGLVGFLFGKWIPDAGPGASFPGWADAGALLLAVALIGQGLVVLGLSLSRRVAGEVFIGEEGRMARPAQLSFFRQQGAVLLLAGVMMALPVGVGIIAGTPPPTALATATMIGVLLTFAVQTALNLAIWKRADEFMRRMISEAGSLSFWVLQALLFLYAAAERLGLVPAITAWDCAVVMMAGYLCASAIISTRNNLGT